MLNSESCECPVCLLEFSIKSLKLGDPIIDFTVRTPCCGQVICSNCKLLIKSSGCPLCRCKVDFSNINEVFYTMRKSKKMNVVWVQLVNYMILEYLETGTELELKLELKPQKTTLMNLLLENECLSVITNNNEDLLSFGEQACKIVTEYKKYFTDAIEHKNLVPIRHQALYYPGSVFPYENDTVILSPIEGHYIHQYKLQGCNFCHAMNRPLSKCKGCYLYSYCGRECQRKHWPEHKKICNDINHTCDKVVYLGKLGENNHLYVDITADYYHESDIINIFYKALVETKNIVYPDQVILFYLHRSKCTIVQYNNNIHPYSVEEIMDMFRLYNNSATLTFLFKFCDMTFLKPVKHQESAFHFDKELIKEAAHMHIKV